MISAAVPWPPAFAGTPAVTVIERALEEGRLSHSLLLAGDDPEGLSAAGLALADRILDRDAGGPAYPPATHPDCLQVRPAGKSRQIGVDAVREMVRRVNVSASVGRNKVVVIHDAERLHPAAANILLKTLEEPPADTTILLLTAHPYALLPTIRSRVLHFRFPGMASPLRADGWEAWVADYRAWLTRLGQGVSPGAGVADSLFSLYGLVARFGLLLDRAAAFESTRRKAALPEGVDDDEVTAIETEAAVGIRLRMFAGIEEATRAHATGLMAAGDDSARRLLTASVDGLEHSARLLRVNLNESVALEDYLLACLRIWARR